MGNSALLPTDANGNAIPCMGYKPDGAHSVAVNGETSARNTTAFKDDTRIVSVYPSIPVCIEQGDDTVTSTVSKHWLPANEWSDISIGGDGKKLRRYIAVVAADGVATGTLKISERD